ncbi:MAG: TIGR00269 family protein [Thermoplasmatota archaeon]
MTAAASVPACSKCSAPSVHFVRYSGDHLCAAHFREFFEFRAKRDLRKQGPWPRGTHIAVGVSGGKDSVVTLRLVHETLAAHPDLRITAVTVDEGIAGYRPPSIEVARRHAEALGVEHVVVSYAEEAGFTMDAYHASRPAELPCGTCGVLRRRSLNRAAKRIGATHVATGHNLDDTAQSVLMNVLKGDVTRLARMGPHAKRDGVERAAGLIPRVMPLRSIPEVEVALYAMLRGFEFHDGECPLSAQATRGFYRDMLLDIEAREPGTRHSLVAGYDRMKSALVEFVGDAGIGECARCGEPTSAKRDGEARRSRASGGVDGASVCSACQRIDRYATGEA